MFSEEKQIRKLLKLPHYSNINLNTSPKHTQNAAFFKTFSILSWKLNFWIPFESVRYLIKCSASELIIWIGHRKEFLKLTFRVLALRQSEGLKLYAWFQSFLSFSYNLTGYLKQGLKSGWFLFLSKSFLLVGKKMRFRAKNCALRELTAPVRAAKIARVTSDLKMDVIER